MPVELVKKVSVEAEVNGVWKELTEIDNNLHRLIKLEFSPVRTSKIRLNLKETYSASDIKLLKSDVIDSGAGNAGRFIVVKISLIRYV